jgi:maltooligosyltrehalose synthase
MMTTEELFERFAREPQIVRRVPVSTYRLQLDRTFTFANALVDPDNRRPVDVAPRRRLLEALAGEIGASTDTAALASRLMTTKEDDRAKLFLSHRALQFRRAQPALILEGEYEPLETRGPLGADACAGFPVALLTRED